MAGTKEDIPEEIQKRNKEIEALERELREIANKEQRHEVTEGK